MSTDGPKNNSVLVMEHIEPDGEHKEKAKTVHRPFNGGKEGWEDWHAKKFTMLTVINTKHKNKRGEPWSYDLVPLRMGNARHYGGDDEVCTHHDFWVTKAKPNEIYYTRLPEYVKDAEPIMNTDVVLWHGAPAITNRALRGRRDERRQPSRLHAHDVERLRPQAAQLLGSQSDVSVTV